MAEATETREETRERWELGGRSWGSRLIVGTGGFRSLAVMEEALEATGTEIVTVALRRVDPLAKGSVLEAVEKLGLFLLPNTAGCYTARDAVKTAQLAREAFETDWIKLEVIGDDRTLLPDAVELVAAAQERSRTGSPSFPTPTTTRCSPAASRTRLRRGDAPGLADRLRRRHPQPHNLAIIIENAGVPVILDAGVGTASDATMALELGCDGVLLASAISRAKDPVAMASAMRRAVEAG